MNCEQVQALLVSYLHHETTPSERTLIRAHLSGCAVCQEEMALLSTTQGQISSTLQRRAVRAVPLPDAWERLEARLAQEAQPSPSKFKAWLSRRAPGVNRLFFQISGGVTMHKRTILTAGVAVLAIVLVAAVILNGVTPVSAQAVLNKAYAAQSSASPAHGIEHIRSEMYTNFQALPNGQGTDMTVESYHDLQTGKTRRVTIDNKTGQVQDVFAYDGTYTYSVESQAGSGPLTVYRTPQGQLADLKPFSDEDTFKLKSLDIFNKMRSDPDVYLNNQETWDDGRKVYVLITQQQIKVLVNDQVERPMGATMVYFDVETYKMVGNRVTMQKDGQEIVISSQKIWADETLPEDASVAWDLSDLQGITLVDDPNRQHGDLLPEVITPQDLAARTTTAYLLEDIPEGYSLEISEPQRKPGSSEPYIYIASYRTEANDYFVIQAGVDKGFGDGDDTYTTASGLVLHFMREFSDPSGKQYVSAYVEAPGGIIFIVSSTLLRETVEAWAEKLILVK